jgi:hypothetical protein
MSLPCVLETAKDSSMVAFCVPFGIATNASWVEGVQVVCGERGIENTCLNDRMFDYDNNRYETYVSSSRRSGDCSRDLTNPNNGERARSMGVAVAESNKPSPDPGVSRM